MNDNNGYDSHKEAKDAARVFTQQRAKPSLMNEVATCLKNSGCAGVIVTSSLMESFDNLNAYSQPLIIQLAKYFFESQYNSSSLVAPTGVLLAHRAPDVREQATEFLCTLGPGAKAAEDIALGCLRNPNAEIRLNGAKVLHSLGVACSKSIPRQLRTTIQRYESDTELCKYLEATVKIISNSLSTNTPAEATKKRVESERLQTMRKFLSDKRVLLAEDNITLALSLIEMLEKFDIHTTHAVNGKIAIDYIENKQPEVDIIILDLKMPEANGITVLKTIRESERFRNIPVLITTAVIDERLTKIAESLGISGYLMKPYKIQDLINTMTQSMLQATVS